jgi:hypothetical protein
MPNKKSVSTLKDIRLAGSLTMIRRDSRGASGMCDRGVSLINEALPAERPPAGSHCYVPSGICVGVLELQRFPRVSTSVDWVGMARIGIITLGNREVLHKADSIVREAIGHSDLVALV